MNVTADGIEKAIRVLGGEVPERLGPVTMMTMRPLLLDGSVVGVDAVKSKEAMDMARTQLLVEREMIRRIIESGETELAGRVYVEILKTPGWSIVWMSGAVKNEGVLPWTPTLMGIPVKGDEAKNWEEWGSQLEPDKVKGISNLKELLVRRLTQTTTRLGEQIGKEQEDSVLLQEVAQYMGLSPDQLLHIFVHGWTGNHCEMQEHMGTMIQGLIEWRDKPENLGIWKCEVMRQLKTNLEAKGLTQHREKLEEIVNKVAERWGAFDPSNHVVLGLGVQGAMGTTRREIAAIKGGGEGDQWVTNDDVDRQIAYAVNALAGELGVMGKGNNNRDEGKGRENVLTKISHWWGHSMGAQRVLLMLDPKHFINRMLTTVGNDHYQIHAWNPVVIGSAPSMQEQNKLGRYVRSELMWLALRSVPMHQKIGLLSFLVRSAPQLLKSDLMQVLNKMVGVSKLTQAILMGSNIAIAANAAHADTTANSLQDQYSLNDRLLAEMRGVFTSDEHFRLIVEAVAEGRLDIANGSYDQQILSYPSIKALQLAVRQKWSVETTDHLMSPEWMRYLASPWILLPRRGCSFGGEYSLANFRALMPSKIFKDLVKPV